MHKAQTQAQPMFIRFLADLNDPNPSTEIRSRQENFVKGGKDADDVMNLYNLTPAHKEAVLTENMDNILDGVENELRTGHPQPHW